MSFENCMEAARAHTRPFADAIGLNVLAIEALANLVDALDAGQRETLHKLMPEFRAMLEQQMRYAKAVDRLELELVYAGS